MPVTCNIDNTDRINRIVIGLGLFLAALLGASTLFYMAVGIILVIQGIIGWCSIPYIIKKFIPQKERK